MDWINLIVEMAISVGLAVITLLVGLAVIKVLVNVISTQISKSKLDESLKPFIMSVISIGLKLVLVVSVVGILGIPTASFVAILGSFGLALGLAFQGSLSNLAGGVLLLTMRPFKVGDYIDGAGYSGTVKAIQILYTELETPDNKMIYVPNGNLSNSGIVNYSVHDTRRVDFTFGVGYETNNAHVLQTLQRIVLKHPSVLLDPEPFIRLSGHGDSAVEYTVRVWTRAEDYWGVHFDILEEVKTTFDEENISIPYPQMAVHTIQE
ncbi:small conductance mechanosensitive channel [Alkalibacterium subtropicum]|uniref:Small conductance mechanosensitive channel n=1 Tax=Alkalibacterium subtropicum TaxID=753702 RepID=A0A1I1L4K0_9LACT|nr:mechanosensitive ion channel domain-containing protein [Alkalibacterium subtropicum]SFC64520.1 small conductance mechanosensitive channel [Alkalibacterium subtropicum]